MGNIAKRIVLTGGPCAGKSSSLELIEDYLRNKRYIVYTVQESATELINSGIKPFGNNAIDIVEFQRIILKYQLYKEKLVENVAKMYDGNKDVVILYDRGINDYKAYISENEYDSLLKEYNLSEENILNRYDVVIHLETAAKSKDYTVENNKARCEDKDKAIELDNKTYNAWIKHKNLIKIKSYDNFIDKQKEIVSVIELNLTINK